MTVVTLTCPACQHENPHCALWCTNCGAPITPSPSPAPDTKTLQSRSQFYQRIVEDLAGHFKQGGIEPQTRNVIEKFYRDQIATLDSAIADHTRRRRIEELVSAARQSAHTGMFQNAIDELEKGMSEYADAYPWKQLIAEVTVKKELRERELERSRQVNELVTEADQHLVSSRFEDAIELLERALAIESTSKLAQSRLARVQTMIAQQRAHEAKQPAPKKQPDTLNVTLEETGNVDAAQVEAGHQPEQEEILIAKLVPEPPTRVEPSFVDTEDETATPHRRWIEAASNWSSIVKPFLLDNVGWFVGAFMVVAGFVVLIFTFWGTIEQNRILMQSLVFLSLAVATGMFFSLAYFMRLKYPQLETSSNVLLVIVALLIPLVFAAAVLTSLVPAEPPKRTQNQQGITAIARFSDVDGITTSVQSQSSNYR